MSAAEVSQIGRKRSGLFIGLLCAVFLPCSLQAKDWERLDGCRLVPTSFNDGDSFLIRQNGREVVLRLYFVDCAEVSDLYPERVTEQASYFGIGRKRTLEMGKAATEYVRRLLSNSGDGGFTVYTRWKDGRGQKKRYLAVVESGGRNLLELLAEQGLVRIHGYKTSTAWPGGWKPAEVGDRLEAAENRAKVARAGAWGFSPVEEIAAKAGSATEVVVEAVGGGDTTDVATGLPLDERKNLNLASAEQLDELPSIGPTLASRIVSGRPFWSVTDLRFVDGIGAKTLAKLMPLITVIDEDARPGTADYLRMYAQRNRDREVQVAIGAVAELNMPAPDGYAVMRALTGRGGEVGGAIAIFFPEEQRERVIEFYSRPQTGLTRAIFYQFQGEDVLVVRRREQAGADAGGASAK